MMAVKWLIAPVTWGLGVYMYKSWISQDRIYDFRIYDFLYFFVRWSYAEFRENFGCFFEQVIKEL